MARECGSRITVAWVWWRRRLRSEGECGLGGDRQTESATTGFAGSGSRLLRDRLGAVHAGVVPGGAALLAVRHRLTTLSESRRSGRNPMVAGSRNRAPGSRQVRDFAGSDAAGMGTAATVAGRGRGSAGDPEDKGGLVPKLALGQLGRPFGRLRAVSEVEPQHAGGSRHEGKPGGLRAARGEAGEERLPATALSLAGRKWDARVVWQPDGGVRPGRNHAGPAGASGARLRSIFKRRSGS